MSVNVVETKQKLLNYINEHGPSLPASLTKISGMNLTFTSAILSELLSDRKLKLSNIRVGSSPLYLVSGQEDKLESFIGNLKEPEVEAFRKLKQNKILDDEKQTPVLRVALRAIKDFAIPLKNHDKLYWKYHLLSDEKAATAISGGTNSVQAIGEERVLGQQIWEDIQKQQLSKERIEEIVRKQVENISQRVKDQEVLAVPLQEISQEISVDNKVLGSSVELPSDAPIMPVPLGSFPSKPLEDLNISEEVIKPISQDENSKNIDSIYPGVKLKKVSKVSKKPKKLSEKDLFLETAKRYLDYKHIEIFEVLKFDANKVIFKANFEGTKIVVFSNKKRIDEPELFKDLKKYSSENLEFVFFINGEPSKKVLEKVNLFKKLANIEKIEEQ